VTIADCFRNMAERIADRPGSLVESHKGYDPRIIFFYFVILGLFLVLVAVSRISSW